jgi:hypothetical protein
VSKSWLDLAAPRSSRSPKRRQPPPTFVRFIYRPFPRSALLLRHPLQPTDRGWGLSGAPSRLRPLARVNNSCEFLSSLSLARSHSDLNNLLTITSTDTIACSGVKALTNRLRLRYPSRLLLYGYPGTLHVRTERLIGKLGKYFAQLMSNPPPLQARMTGVESLSLWPSASPVHSSSNRSRSLPRLDL